MVVAENSRSSSIENSRLAMMVVAIDVSGREKHEAVDTSSSRSTRVKDKNSEESSRLAMTTELKDASGRRKHDEADSARNNHEAVDRDISRATADARVDVALQGDDVSDFTTEKFKADSNSQTPKHKPKFWA